jgi:hypothetical protein
MWMCSKCREEVDDDFEVCWNCGTTREGEEDATFRPDVEGVMDDKTYAQDLAARQDEQFVTVAVFGNAPEAHMVRSRLEAEGIRAYVMDELATTTLGFLTPPDGIPLQVAERDAARARSILAELPHLSQSREEYAEEESDMDDEEEEWDEDYEEEGENFEEEEEEEKNP